jgi:hypothetical protein
MNTAERFIRFAAECKDMAKFTRTPENKTVWMRMAERWLQCAELHDRQTSAVHEVNLAKRNRRPERNLAQ